MNNEIRYIKIDLCSLCSFNGHITDTNKDIITFVCTNPINDNVDVNRAEIAGKYYPITSIGKSLKDNKIPIWCKLPKTVA